ncbi:MAG: MBL fold metallo-hydrolase [Rubrobacter sp.]|nr:MBL fold metallo-hydrolase [Rubrobacter sp.]MBA3951780.1 MBL fold metallo-hydrolase [Rubrobacter sp.]MDQ3363789.1 MBL fold metallo-hydrolase [Actinomycetota bacterium]MDQ3375616.1 MBL fold metallo-hydrolase [Actinomycetota bacterium]
MEITVVGSGTVVPRLERRQSCVVVEAGGEMLVFDLGAGAVTGMVAAGLDPFATDRVFFTHFHPDHTVDAANLLFAMNYGTDEPRTNTLHVTGPEPFESFWSSILRVWGEWMQGDYPIRTRELPHACDSPLELGGCSLSWAPAVHRPESIAYRLDGETGSFVYTGDTDYSPSVVELARGADTLLIECSTPDDAPVPGHLTPGGVARMASEAAVGRVVLTHLYPAVDDGRLPEAVAKGFDGEVLLAHDRLRLNV